MSLTNEDFHSCLDRLVKLFVTYEDHVSKESYLKGEYYTFLYNGYYVNTNESDHSNYSSFLNDLVYKAKKEIDTNLLLINDSSRSIQYLNRANSEIVEQYSYFKSDIDIFFNSFDETFCFEKTYTHDTSSKHDHSKYINNTDSDYVKIWHENFKISLPPVYINMKQEEKTLWNNSMMLNFNELIGIQMHSFEKLIDFLESKRKDLDNIEIPDIIPLKLNKSFPEYLVNIDKEKFAEILRLNFNTERGKNIRILIDLLKDNNPPLLAINNRRNNEFHSSMNDYFSQDIGSYQGIFNKPVTDSIFEEDKKPIRIKLQHCLSLLD